MLPFGSTGGPFVRSTTTSAASSSSTCTTTTPCWSSMRPSTCRGHRHGGCAAPVHRHHRTHREQPGRRLPRLLQPCGHAAIDRQLGLPPSWAEGAARCRQAAVPDTLGFAMRPALAARMIGHALDTGAPASRVAGDEVCGGNPHLRTALERRKAAISSPSPATIRSHARRQVPRRSPGQEAAEP
ncbi:transposase [Streptomyces decoyicus]